MLTYAGDITNYLGVNKNKKSDGTFELSQLHLLEKIINHVGFKLYVSLKSRETPSVKSLLNKDDYILRMKIVWNYRPAVGVLSFIKVSVRPEIPMTINQCAQFRNNPRLVQECVVKLSVKYLSSMSTDVDLSYGNRRLYTCSVVYNHNK